eukprot:CAMPEP_0170510074 /NCGR_PEP_ID=MMETSP0208-20121228/65564_1 /TAXON_ID=197538 /ORGANISM="Strombidium inclinatum, Strain S3" /LENGTH=54 /DNA_ID=CAMNT_0010793497 /DNA_START=731 /DNA_END=895 /DNA_ORIENTATION=+
MASELMYDLLGDHQAQANAVLVHTLGRVHEAEEFEESVLIFTRDADPSIDDIYL